MTDPDHYLRIVLGGADCLLPGRHFTIEQLDTLVPAGPAESPVLAWRERGGRRDPVYCLGSDFRPASAARGRRAVFIEAPRPVGLIGEEIELLARRLRVEPFTPPGPPPAGGHLFNAAWTGGARPMLVIDPPVFLKYLHSLGRE